MRHALKEARLQTPVPTNMPEHGSAKGTHALLDTEAWQPSIAIGRMRGPSVKKMSLRTFLVRGREAGGSILTSKGWEPTKYLSGRSSGYWGKPAWPVGREYALTRRTER